MSNCKSAPVNLASLPREEALERARGAGREILIDSDAITAVSQDLWTNWMDANVPHACGQSEDEYGALVNSMMREFQGGLADGVNRFARDARTLERVEELVQRDARFAWKIYNVLAWMVEGLPDDAAGALPMRCTSVDLRQDVEKLAASLMDLVHGARHE